MIIKLFRTAFYLFKISPEIEFYMPIIINGYQGYDGFIFGTQVPRQEKNMPLITDQNKIMATDANDANNLQYEI